MNCLLSITQLILGFLVKRRVKVQHKLKFNLKKILSESRHLLHTRTLAMNKMDTQYCQMYVHIEHPIPEIVSPLLLQQTPCLWEDFTLYIKMWLWRFVR